VDDVLSVERDVLAIHACASDGSGLEGMPGVDGENNSFLNTVDSHVESMTAGNDADRLLAELDLPEYEATALKHLLTIGRTTAPNLSEATGIPKARIYDVLDTLSDAGYVEVIPSRPKEYQPKPPEEILDRAVENQRQDFESFRHDIDGIRDEFVETFEPLYEKASEDVTPAEELFHVVDVGEPSEAETRRLYRSASESLTVLTKSFEYFDAVEPAFADVYDRSVRLRLLFLHPDLLSESNRAIQREIRSYILDTYPEVSIRYSNERLPWRGTVVDPSMDYDTGKAIFLVEEEDVPLYMRQAAVTENESFVAGMGRYCDLIWEYDSVGEYPDEGLDG
jgi:sugar-specific transcriptional regulator TrmB